MPPVPSPTRTIDGANIGLRNEAGCIDKKEVGSETVVSDCREGMLRRKAVLD